MSLYINLTWPRINLSVKINDCNVLHIAVQGVWLHGTQQLLRMFQILK